MNVLQFILGLLPIIWLIIAMAGIKMAGWKACVIALVIAVVEAIAYKHLPVVSTGSAVVEGALNALWPIILVILAALFAYNLVVETKAMEAMKHMLTGVSMDTRVLALLIGWGFGNFMEGMAGFGTAVAIPAAILVAMGYNPVKTVVACLVVNATPTAFGSVGVPTVTLANVTGLDVRALSANTGTVEALLMFLSPFFMIVIIGGGFKALKGCMGMTILAAASFTVPCVVASHFIGAELPNILGSIICMVCIFIFARMGKGQKIPGEYRAEQTEEMKNASYSSKDYLVAWSPFILIFIVLVITNLIPAVKTALAPFASKFQIYVDLAPNAKPSPLGFTWINTPGVWIFICAFIGAAIQKASAATTFRVLGKTIKSNWKTIVTICSVVAIAKVMGHSGMTKDIAVFLAGATGAAFPLISPLIGTLGGFVTGSGTSTCILFGPLQADTANAIGSEPAWLAAANTMGAGIGKMISPQGIAIGTAAVGLAGSESKVLSSVAKFAVIFFVIGGILCFVMPKIGF